jgi:hypothetical protein
MLYCQAEIDQKTNAIYCNPRKGSQTCDMPNSIVVIEDDAPNVIFVDEGDPPPPCVTVPSALGLSDKLHL